MSKHSSVFGCIRLLAASIGLLTFVLPAIPYAGTTINYLGASFVDQQTFVEVANKVGKDLGIEIRPNWIPFDDVRTKFAVDFRAGVRTWDTLFVYTNWVGDFATGKMLVPLDDFLTTPEAKALVNPSDFIPATVQGLMYQGKLMAMPYEAAPFMLAVRSDLIADAGEQKAFQAKYGYALAAPQTYKQFMDVAQFFTRKKGEQLVGKILDDDFFGVVAANKAGSFLFNRYKHFAVAFGADLIYDQKSIRPTWNSPENMAAAKFYVELNRYMPPGNLNMTSGEALGIYKEGRAAMVFNSLDGALVVLNDPKTSKVVGKVEYTLMPTQIPSRPHAFVQDANGVGISALSDNKEQAFKLLAHALSTKGAREMFLGKPGLVPMRASIVDDPELSRQVPQVAKALKQVITEKPYVVFVPILKEWPQAQDIAIASISEALAGQKPVEQALNEAQARLLDLFKRSGYVK